MMVDASVSILASPGGAMAFFPHAFLLAVTLISTSPSPTPLHASETSHHPQEVTGTTHGTIGNDGDALSTLPAPIVTPVTTAFCGRVLTPAPGQAPPAGEREAVRATTSCTAPHGALSLTSNKTLLPAYSGTPSTPTPPACTTPPPPRPSSHPTPTPRPPEPTNCP